MSASLTGLGNILARLMLGDPGTASAVPDEKLRAVVDAYGECIAVLIASTKTYLDQKLERLPARQAVQQAALADARDRLAMLQQVKAPVDEVALQSEIVDLKAKIDVMERQCADLAVELVEVPASREKLERLEDKFRGRGSVTNGQGADMGTRTADVEQRSRFECYIELDAQLIAIIPDDFLVARRWVLLDRMRRIAPQKAMIEYEASRPPSMQQGSLGDAAAIRADLLSLSAYMQQLYILNARREQTLASIKWWLLSRVLGVVMAIAIIFWLATTRTPGWLFGAPWSLPWMTAGLVLIFLTGMVGAVVSISRKFQDIGGQNILLADPFNELISLNFSRESVAGSIAAGGVFALVLYLMVVSGSTDALGLEVRFFPSLTERRMIIDPLEANQPPPSAKPHNPIGATPKPDPQKTPKEEPVKQGQYVVRAPDDVPPGIGKLSKELGFFYTGDILRMMLLAFLAGFAERLVPDSIDRLVRKEKAVKDAAV
ncbi:MAG: hypothetical protein AABZ76_07745 [Pseudomonadota bacterium]|uniref:hypothetical protein n=1 Tax=Sphingobium yanoikuyae TaxID=13690 RepID=UPI00137844B2|nr:hypothetical protein [Sphingobium yanoikuyae]KAK0333776.1 hypothetical protein LTR94_019404 [Friedmanniomyces endolithicus]NBB40428.1 hypothetical protein [Sphingobium yanoikuyae]